jgi:ribosomal-protein-alanine N-acetyltransferase
VRIGLEDVGLDELVAFTLPANVRSRRVMEKAGLGYEKDIVHAGLPHVLYRIRRGSSSEG